MIGFAQYLHRHTLHRAGLVTCTARPTVSYLGQVKVDEHALEAIGCFRVRDNDVIRRDVAVQDLALDVERPMRFDRIPLGFQQFLDGSKVADDTAGW